MPKIYIELDYEVVAAAIKAKVPAAVEDILRRYDLQRIIEAAIVSNEKFETKVIEELPSSRFGVFPMWLRADKPQSPREKFEEILHSAINAQLEKGISKWLKEHPELLRAAIEKQLPRTLSKLKLTITTNDDED